METSADKCDDIKKRSIDFAQKDYELKVAYLTNHFQRMWTRFNYFVVIESALIGGKTLFGSDTPSRGGLLFGLGLSLVWYVMGAEDRYLVQVYRARVGRAADVVVGTLPNIDPGAYNHVAAPPTEVEKIAMSISGWRLDPISTTRLAAIIPLAVSVIWACLLIKKLL